MELVLSFREKIKQKVNQAIKQFSMFNRQDRLLLAISGGKDSLGLASLLKDLNYSFSCLFIDLELGEFSLKSAEKVSLFCKKLQLPMQKVSVREELGIDMQDVMAHYPKNACAACGSIKRKIFNRYALKNSFDVLVTGHQLDDEAFALFSNNFRWDFFYLKKSFPVSNSKDGFIKRGKPLCFCRENETGQYALEEGIDFITDKCPFSATNTRSFYKNIFIEFEKKYPHWLEEYYKNFLNQYALLNSIESDRAELKRCQLCGDLTAHEICRVCLIKNHDWKR